MVRLLFTLAGEELEYEGKVDVFTQPYLQLLRVIECREQWANDCWLPRMYTHRSM